MQSLELALHRQIIISVGGLAFPGREKFDPYGAKRVGCWVSSTAKSAFHRWVGAGLSGATGGDRALVVLGAVWLGADGAGGFLRFAEGGVVAVNLAVAALGGWCPGEVFGNPALTITEKEGVGADLVEVDHTAKGDHHGGGLFVEAALIWN